MGAKYKLARGDDRADLFSVGSAATKYPWDTWFCDDLYLIERSEGEENDKGTVVVPTVARDYGVPILGMPPKIKTAARRRYKVCQISRRDAKKNKLPNGGYILLSRDMTPDERIAEDLLRAEEKEALKAKKANGADETAADDDVVDEAAA